MDLSQNDAHEKNTSESLLENGFKVNIVKKSEQNVKIYSPLWRQSLGCCSPLMCSVAIGNVVGYSSILISQLKYEDSTIQLNASEESWIASIATIAMAIACILGGVIMEKYGRKQLFLISNTLFLIGWMIFCCSVDIYGLLLGRFITGCCVGLLTAPVSIYIGEITQPSYRAFFLAAQVFTSSFGILMAHALGMFFNWKIIAGICASIPLICNIVMSIVPESPPWLLKNGQMEKAVEAFTWFRGHSRKSMDELENLIEGQKLSKLHNFSMGFKNILTLAQSKAFYKPLSISLIYIATEQSCGPSVIAFYTVTILKNCVPTINEYVATIILDVTRVIASVFCCIVVRNVGRRPLTTFSGLATATTLFGLSTYLYFASTDENLKSLWGIPLTLFTLYIIFVTVGLQPLSWTIKAELFPLRYRGAGSALVTFLKYLYTFLAVKMTPGLFLAFGEQGVFLLFGLCCLIGTIVLTIVLPETRNKTLQEIEDSYGDNTTAKLRRVKIQNM